MNLMEPDERDHSGAPFVDYAPMFERIAANSGASVRCRRFPVPDLGVPDVATMHRILNAIDAAVADGIPVMVSFILLEIAEIGILILDRPDHSVEANMLLLDRISFDSKVMGGKPCIRGMRVTVGTIVGLVAAGHGKDKILSLYPYLELEDIEQALSYAAWRVEEIEVPIARESA